jgi:hypothetical protein
LDVEDYLRFQVAENALQTGRALLSTVAQLGETHASGDGGETRKLGSGPENQLFLHRLKDHREVRSIRNRVEAESWGHERLKS